MTEHSAEFNRTSTLNAVKSRALRILGSRALSSVEVKKRLVSKGESEKDADEVIQWLIEVGYIDDDALAKLVVNSYNSKGYGAARIRSELYKRGIDRELWEDAMEALEEEVATAATFRLLEKKLRGSEDKEDLRRAAEMLIRRGYSYDEASEAIRAYSGSNEE